MKKPEKPPVSKQTPPIQATIKFLIETNHFEDLYKIERENYPYWEELKQRVKHWGHPPENIWYFIKHQRQFHKLRIAISKIPDFTFGINEAGIIKKNLHEFDLHMGGIMEGESIIPDEDKNRYLISSIMEEAIASSQIEGAVTTRKIAKEMLEQNRKPKNKSEQMIVNNYNTMKWIVQNKNIKMTPEILLSIHKQITKATLDVHEDEGRFRDNDNVKVMDETNEVFYEPPLYTNIKKLVQDFCDFANEEAEEKEFLHPVIRSIMLHFLIGYIHPFTDGNGRTARALFYWYLIKKGYWLTEYMSISRIILKAKSQYARAYLFTEYDENDLTYFVIYNTKAMKEALDDLKKYINHKIAEKRKVLSLLKYTGFNDRQVVVIKDILKDKSKLFTVKQIESRFNVSNQTARNDLTSLVKKGILIEKVVGKKSQFFVSDDFEKQLKIN